MFRKKKSQISVDGTKMVYYYSINRIIHSIIVETEMKIRFWFIIGMEREFHLSSLSIARV